MKKLKNVIKLLLIIALSSVSMDCFAQVPTDSLPDDPAAMRVFKVQDFNFGSFSHSGAGGSVTLSANGSRTSEGAITLLNVGSPPVPAIFEIDAPYQTVVSISMNGPFQLTSPNNGTITLELIGSTPGPVFTTEAIQPQRTPVTISGKLIVGNATVSPAGTYTGTFDVTFYQE